MAVSPSGVFYGIIDSNNGSVCYVKIVDLINGQAEQAPLPYPAIIMTEQVTIGSTVCTIGPNVTPGSQVMVGFLGNLRTNPVILGNYQALPTWNTYTPKGTLLQVVEYAPGSTTVYNAASSASAIDATNLSVEFTVPPSGAIMATADIWGRLEPNGADEPYMILTFTTHDTNTVVAPYQRFLESIGNSEYGVLVAGACSYQTYITGLTPGAILQWDLAGFYVGSNLQAIFAVGDNAASGSPGQGQIAIYAG